MLCLTAMLRNTGADTVQSACRVTEVHKSLIRRTFPGWLRVLRSRSDNHHYVNSRAGLPSGWLVTASIASCVPCLAACGLRGASIVGRSVPSAVPCWLRVACAVRVRPTPPTPSDTTPIESNTEGLVRAEKNFQGWRCWGLVGSWEGVRLQASGSRKGLREEGASKGLRGKARGAIFRRFSRDSGGRWKGLRRGFEGASDRAVCVCVCTVDL